MVTWGSSILRNLHVLPLDTHNWTDMLSNIECQRSSPGPSGHCTLKWKSSLVHSTIDLGPAKSWNMYDIAWVQLIWFTKRTIHGLLWISMDFADSWHKIKQSEMRTHSFKSKKYNRPEASRDWRCFWTSQGKKSAVTLTITQNRIWLNMFETCSNIWNHQEEKAYAM